MEQCWLCPRKFNTKTELNSHLISKEHRRQSVICPFCVKESTYTRVTDLVKHCNQKHFITYTNKPKSFFSVNNCFYFSVYPEDYCKIITPEPFYSGVAIEARQVMTQWADKQGDPERKNKIRSGWRVMLKRAQNDIDKTTSNNQIIESVASPNQEDQEVNVETTINTTPLSSCSFLNNMDSSNIDSSSIDSSNNNKLDCNNNMSNEVLDLSVKPSVLSESDETDCEDEVNHRQVTSKSNRCIKVVKTDMGVRRIIVIPKKNTPTNTLSTSPPSSTSSPSFIQTTNTTDVNVSSNVSTPSVQLRAENLLMSGGMPLFPPGRRDWTKVTGPVEFDINGSKLLWPPTNWSLMSPDRKLMEWEQMAMTMELQSTGSINIDISRSYLLSKYNFLGLQGSKVCFKEDHEVITNKLRYYNYTFLQDLCLGKQASSTDIELLNTLEKTSSSTCPVDLKQLTVPLRLKKD